MFLVVAREGRWTALEWSYSPSVLPSAVAIPDRAALGHATVAQPELLLLANFFSSLSKNVRESSEWFSSPSFLQVSS